MSSKIVKLLPLHSWRFVKDDALRQVLIRDYRELRKILKVGARKSAIVLCGSILEAVLVAKLSSSQGQADYSANYSRELDVAKMPEWGLENLINVCKKLNYLDDDAQRQAQVVQKFRNYIHPNAAMQPMAQIDANSVASSVALLNRVIKLVEPPPPPPPPSTQREKFIRKLGKKCSQHEVKTAEEIINWLEVKGFQPHWSSKLVYVPRLRHNGYTYIPIKINPNGKFQISFRSFLKKPSIFRNIYSRETLRKRLNAEVLEERIRPTRVDGHCTFPLALLASETNLMKFFDVFDWVVTSIRQ